MPNVKIGIQTRSLRQPLRSALVTASRLGAAGVEIDARSELRPRELSQTGLRDFHKLLADLSLLVSAIAFPTRRGYDDVDDLERRVLATQEAMRFAAELHTDVIILRPGRVPAETETAPLTRLVESLTALGTFGERIGVRPALQTADVNPQDLLRLIKQLPDQSVGVDLHPTGLIMAGHSPQEAIDLLGPHVLHVHACDAVRDFASRQTLEVELGRGAADIPELLGKLTEFDYRGWVTIERRDSPNPVDEIGNAVEFLTSL
ncbi:MAG TPA: sugar phosphate isomerase/epimerase family protein [Lacipirellulaceae bacterium]|nr:sugar phosphate isomerase/epimerase family protein [Lacipirellulaceae bacterium]